MQKITVRFLENAFKPYLEEAIFLEVFDLVKQNSKGKIWLIGGYLYRNLAAVLYGGQKYNYDIDFIVEQRNDILKDVPGWRIEVNNYGAKNYVRLGNRMSFTDIRKFIRVSGLKKYTIEEIIDTTPFNIQSIAYDFGEGRIIGEKGIGALIKKVVKINNIDQAKFYAERKGQNLKDMIIKKAEELGFNYELPEELI
jgi:hypothetical protein